MAMYFGFCPVKIIQRSKNLIPFPYNLREWQDPDKKGLEFTVNNDGTISLNGVATGKEGFSVFDYAKLDLVAGKKYWLSGVEDVPYCSLTLLEFIDGVWVGSYTCGRTAEAFTAKENATYSLSFAAPYGATYNNALVKPMINEGSGPAPYGKKDSNIYFRIRRGVKKRNEKNLIPFPYPSLGGAGSITKQNGVTVTVQADGGIYLKGTATGEAYFNLCQIRFAEESLNIWEEHIVYTDGNVCISKSGAIDNVSAAFDANNNITFIYVKGGVSYDGVVYIMLNEGTKALPYYIEY